MIRNAETGTKAVIYTVGTVKVAAVTDLKKRKTVLTQFNI